jgi:deoxyadenosine/deoxycytidine kinase
MELSNLYDELLAISIIDINECKEDKDKMIFLKTLLEDFYLKMGEKKFANGSDIFIMIKRNELVKRILKDSSLNMDQKILLYNNFSDDKIVSKSQVRRLIFQKCLT